MDCFIKRRIPDFPTFDSHMDWAVMYFTEGNYPFIHKKCSVSHRLSRSQWPVYNAYFYAH